MRKNYNATSNFPFREMWMAISIGGMRVNKVVFRIEFLIFDPDAFFHQAYEVGFMILDFSYEAVNYGVLKLSLYDLAMIRHKLTDSVWLSFCGNGSSVLAYKLSYLSVDV